MVPVQTALTLLHSLPLIRRQLKVDKGRMLLRLSPTSSALFSNNIRKFHHRVPGIPWISRFPLSRSATTPTQKIITTSKGIALDLDSTSRDVKAQSKELYTWGQQEPEDLKDGLYRPRFRFACHRY
jgi:hypothetical protein